MGNTDNLGNWEQIRRGVVEVEHLISQKQFNASMIESLEVLNLMLKGLAEKACIIDTDPMIIIDRLYQDRWISRSTCEHYHKIRTIGTRALNENSSNAYDASQAYQLLSQEVYTFANEFYKVRKKRPVLRSSSAPWRKILPQPEMPSRPELRRRSRRLWRPAKRQPRRRQAPRRRRKPLPPQIVHLPLSPPPSRRRPSRIPGETSRRTPVRRFP